MSLSDSSDIGTLGMSRSLSRSSRKLTSGKSSSGRKNEKKINRSKTLRWWNSDFVSFMLGQTSYNGDCTHSIMVSRIQWKPFWLATQSYPQNDWTGWQNGVNDDVCAQAPYLKRPNLLPPSIHFTDQNIFSVPISGLVGAVQRKHAGNLTGKISLGQKQNTELDRSCMEGVLVENASHQQICMDTYRFVLLSVFVFVFINVAPLLSSCHFFSHAHLVTYLL